MKQYIQPVISLAILIIMVALFFSPVLVAMNAIGKHSEQNTEVAFMVNSLKIRLEEAREETLRIRDESATLLNIDGTVEDGSETLSKLCSAIESGFPEEAVEPETPCRITGSSLGGDHSIITAEVSATTGAEALFASLHEQPLSDLAVSEFRVISVGDKGNPENAKLRIRFQRIAKTDEAGS